MKGSKHSGHELQAPVVREFNSKTRNIIDIRWTRACRYLILNFVCNRNFTVDL